jgi:hypothetical protein
VEQQLNKEDQMWAWIKSIFQPKAIISDLEKLLTIIENTPTSELVSIVQQANSVVGGKQSVNVNSLAIIITFVKAIAEVIEAKKS